MKKKVCHIRDEGEPRCQGEYFVSLKVDVIHSDTGRKTRQTWAFCQKHFEAFMKDNGEEWFTWYHRKPYKRAFVTGYKVIDDL
jgi:hypothetical protein